MNGIAINASELRVSAKGISYELLLLGQLHILLGEKKYGPFDTVEDSETFMRGYDAATKDTK